MSTPPGSSRPPLRPIFSQDEVELRQIAHALWRYRFVIVGCGLLGGLLGLGVGWLSTSYVSQGLFLTPGMTLASFKRYEASMANEPRFHEFVELSGRKEHFATPLVERLIDFPELLPKAIRPVFGFTSRDAKAFDVDVPQAEDAIVGVQLTLVDDVRHASSPLFSLADYFRSMVIKVDLQPSIAAACLTHEQRQQELRNEQLQSEFDVAQQRRRADSLRRIMRENPEASGAQDRQVVLLETGGERYLSPAAQLVAVEVAISDMELEGARRERSVIATGLKKAYYCQAQALIETALTGPQYLDRLRQLQGEVFPAREAGDNIIEQAANELEIERRNWVSTYLEKMRFVASPEGHSTRLRSPSLKIGLLGGGILGGLFGLLFALVLAWWHDNRDQVLAKE